MKRSITARWLLRIHLQQAKYFIESIDNRNCDDIAASLDSSTKVIKICEEIIGR